METWLTQVVHHEQVRRDMDITFNVTSSFYIWGPNLWGALCQNCHRGNDYPGHLFAFEGT